MPDVEKVISDLEEQITWIRDNDFHKFPGWGHAVIAMKDAIALLKAQEPRVMTLEEVNALDWDYCYLEQERQPGKEYRMIAGDYALTCITWPCITSMRIEYGDSSYGVRWRCWTSRPTEAEREATPWN